MLADGIVETTASPLHPEIPFEVINIIAREDVYARGCGQTVYTRALLRGDRGKEVAQGVRRV